MVKVMLVDDEDSFATTLGERLQLRDFEICLAFTGKQAISMMAEEGPNVALVDLSLPDMTGLEVMGKLKEIDSSVEVIILSGHGMEHRDEGLKKGAFSYMMKPVRLLDLIGVIDNAYEHRAESQGA